MCMQVLLRDDFIDKILADISDIGDVEQVRLTIFVCFLSLVSIRIIFRCLIYGQHSKKIACIKLPNIFILIDV